MPIRRNHQPDDRTDYDVETLLRQVADRVALRCERDRIALEVRTADLVAREARVDVLTARIAELEAALTRATAPAPTFDAVAPAAKRRRLGKHLVKEGVVDPSIVRDALKEHRRTGARLGEILIARGALSPTALLQSLTRRDGVAEVGADDRGVGLLPAAFALEHRTVALDVPGRPARPGAPAAVAVLDLAGAVAVSEALGHAVEPRLADAATLVRLLAQAYGEDAEPVGPVGPVSEDAPAPAPKPAEAPSAEEAADTPPAAPASAPPRAPAPIATAPAVAPKSIVVPERHTNGTAPVTAA
jgi:hypothetical protein